MIKNVFLVLGGFIALEAIPPNVALAAPPPKAPIVFTDTVRSGVLFDVLTYPARLIPTINATLLADVEGIVQKVLTPLGRPVKRGQKLIILANTDPVYDYAPLTVTAPVRGVVSGIEVSEGSRVIKGQKLATITDPTQVKITIEVSVGDLNAITPGLVGDLSVPGPDGSILVKVLGVSPFVDPATGSATAELTVVNKAKTAPLPPGLVGKVSFKAREHLGIQVPESAITYRGPDAFLRTVEDGKAKFQPVQLGQSRRGQIEVLKGVKEGASIILRANAFVADGESVSVQKPEGPKS